MTLSSVAYEFFDFEEPSPCATELARQIRLEFSEAPALYVSWTWKRQYDRTNVRVVARGRQALGIARAPAARR